MVGQLRGRIGEDRMTAAVAIMDTSIFCELLNLPNMNSSHSVVKQEFVQLMQDDTLLLLPMATVYETGNHIAQLNSGDNRRRFAQLFVQQVQMSLKPEPPWQLLQIPDRAEVSLWLSEFPDCAMREISMGDLSIRKEWEKAIARHPHWRVFIWSLDADLKGYDHQP